MIEKGKIVSIEGPEDRCGDLTMAKVQPLSRPEIVTTVLITIPWYYRGKMGDLKTGDEVVYVFFDDNTGLIISRMDGNRTEFWAGNMELDHEGSIKCMDIENNNISCNNIANNDIDCNNISANEIDSTETTASGKALSSHTHSRGYSNNPTGPPI